MDKKTKRNEFDAVKMMGEARDRISRDIEGMSFEEQATYFRLHAERARTRLKATEKSQAV